MSLAIILYMDNCGNRITLLECISLFVKNLMVCLSLAGQI